MTESIAKASFAMIWRNFRETSPTNRRLGPSQVVSFPYMLEGDARQAMQAGQRVALGPVELLRGIMIGYLDLPPVVDVSKPHLRDALDDLVTLLSAPSLEILLIDAAADMRERHSMESARIALETGMTILPQSSLMRSDYIMTTWSAITSRAGMADFGLEESQRLCGDIVTAYSSIDLDIVEPDAVEFVVYAQLVALSYLRRQSERDQFAAHQAVEYIRRPALARLVAYILARDAFDLRNAIW
ncbi:MAG: hypothetical protein ABI229_06220 [Gemmatimonadaceae bacterium]